MPVASAAGMWKHQGRNGFCSTMILQKIQNWKKRHRNPTNFWIHMAGIPMSFIAAPLLAIFGLWPVAISLFVTGYALQFIGHLIEGNRSGEEQLLRKILSRKRN